MNSLEIQASSTTPEIRFDPTAGEFNMHGRLITEDTVTLFSTLERWFNTYALNPAKNTVLTLAFEFINTGGLKAMVKFLKSLEVLNNKGSNIEIHWSVAKDDVSMIEIGEDIKAVVELPFRIVQENG